MGVFVHTLMHNLDFCFECGMPAYVHDIYRLRRSTGSEEAWSSRPNHA